MKFKKDLTKMYKLAGKMQGSALTFEDLNIALEQTKKLSDNILIDLSLANYIGTSCYICGHVFLTITELKKAIWWGNKTNPLVCSDKCFREADQERYLHIE